VYQFQLAPVPGVPPITTRVVNEPAQTADGVTVADTGFTDGTAIEVISRELAVLVPHVLELVTEIIPGKEAPSIK